MQKDQHNSEFSLLEVDNAKMFRLNKRFNEKKHEYQTYPQIKEFKTEMEYKEYQKRLYSIFQGIQKKEYPKWNGWAIIQEYKELHIKPQDIKDLRLECCVQNLHFLVEIQNSYGIDLHT